jgi:hypothetical protein
VTTFYPPHNLGGMASLFSDSVRRSFGGVIT